MRKSNTMYAFYILDKYLTRCYTIIVRRGMNLRYS
nr:MAG TPA: hypothetical protein [Caudoviricetes sp.]